MDKKKHKKKDNDIINYYEKIPKKYKNNYHNPNYEKHLINLPFRVLINGSSGSGKTMIALNIIQKLMKFVSLSFGIVIKKLFRVESKAIIKIKKIQTFKLLIMN